VRERERQQQIQDHLGLVKLVAAKFARRLPSHIAMDDLVSAGTVGLIDAVDKFDRAKATQFERYAEIRIKGAILDELRALDHATRTHRAQQSELAGVIREVEAESGEAATQEGIADHMGMDLAAYQRLADKLKPVFVMSIEDLTGAGPDGGRDPADVLEDPQASSPQLAAHFEHLRAVVGEAIEGLKDKQRTAIRLYFFQDMNLAEIGKTMGVSESRISQVISEAITTLQRRVRGTLKRVKATTNMID
jgi:RNA polymerase sigma factor for flagellar operon FliA